MYMAAFCISQLREKEIIQRSGYLLLTMDGGEGFVFLNTKKEKVDHSVGSLISEWTNTNTNNEKVYHFMWDHSSENGTKGKRKLFQRKIKSKTLLRVPF